jgi:GMP synthase (glutamine-hydrolysing)
MVAIIDFGSQYTNLILRRLRQLCVRAEIFPPNFTFQKRNNIKSIILSGGPQSGPESFRKTTYWALTISPHKYLSI